MPSSIGESSAVSGTIPISFCRARVCSRYASQPMSNWPLYRSAHSGQMWCGACIAPNAKYASHGFVGAIDRCCAIQLIVRAARSSDR